MSKNKMSPKKNQNLNQPADESSFGHKLGEDHGQQGSPLGGEISVETTDSRYTGEGRLRIDSDNAIEGQTHAKSHNSGSRSGQS